MKNSTRIIIRVSCFLIVFCLIFAYGTAVLSPKWAGISGPRSRTYSFYLLPKDSLDVLFLGASTLLNGVSPLTMWELQGFTSYVLGSPGRPPLVTYYYLVESLKYQNPMVVVVDAGTYFTDYNIDKKEEWLRYAIDPLKISNTKLLLVKEVIARSKTQTMSSYFLPLLRYHSRWMDVKKFDFEFYKINYSSYIKGFVPFYRIVVPEFPDNFMLLSSINEKSIKSSDYYFNQIVSLCKENNIHLILMTPPRTDWTYSKYLTLKSFAERNGIEYLDYNLPENMNRIRLNLLTDFKDNKHLNVFGAIKFSNDLSYYLQQNFQFIDKRQNPAFSQWNMDAKKLKDAMEAGWANLQK